MLPKPLANINTGILDDHGFMGKLCTTSIIKYNNFIIEKESQQKVFEKS